ncbi:ribosomal protein L39 [Columba livia]|uniref:Ribosomal protein L39 n=1 Tax=Columba livia TaxID=8932 RepID=A0A2I0MB37_COLLI|nr:ribosomal protein L39 [Columba livia]
MSLVFLRQMDTPALWFGDPRAIPSIMLGCSPRVFF